MPRNIRLGFNCLTVTNPQTSYTVLCNTAVNSLWCNLEKSAGYSTVVEHGPHPSKVEGSSPAATAESGREKMAGKEDLLLDRVFTEL